MSCKIIDLASRHSKFSGLPSFVDKLLDESLSYRKIASKVRKEYDISMSYESIRKYDLIRKNGMITSSKTEEPKRLVFIRRIKRC